MADPPAVRGGDSAARRFLLRGDGSQIRDFTHVDDAVDATVRALSAERPDPC